MRKAGLAFAALDFLGAIFVWALIQLAPPPSPASAIPTHGSYAVILTWPGSDRSDVDLHVREPDGGHVWYAAKDGTAAFLEHDDLGTKASSYGQGGHFERIVIRGVVPGEYVANVQVYQQVVSHPVGVVVELWRLDGIDKRVVSRRFRLDGMGVEATAFRFTVTNEGGVEGVNRLPATLLPQ